MQITHTNRADEKISAHIYNNQKNECEVVVSIGHYEVSVIIEGNSVEVVTDTTSDRENEDKEQE